MGGLTDTLRRLAPRGSAQAPGAVDLIQASNRQTRAVTNLPVAWTDMGLSSTSAGVSVGPSNALAHADIYACVRVLAESVATLPLHVYRDTTTGRVRADDTGVGRLLAAPAPGFTPFGLWSTVMTHLLLWGNAYIAKLRPLPRGGVGRLFPLPPERVQVRSSTGGEPVYVLNPGTQDGLSGEFNRRDILHVRALSSDGFTGLSVIAQARQAIGNALAMEDFAGRFFANGAYPGGVIQMAGKLSPESAKRLRDDWERFHRGTERSHRVAVLEDGAQFNSIGMPPEDAQFVQQRRLSATQIARVFRVPPWMIAADSGDSLTYSNVEQQAIQFATYSVRPWLVILEQALAADEDLFAAGGTLYPEFLMDALLRADTATRTQAYTTALGGKPWMTVNEVRERENLTAVADGNELDAPDAGDDTEEDNDMESDTPEVQA